MSGVAARRSPVGTAGHAFASVEAARLADRNRTDGIIKPPYRWAKPLSDPVGGTDKNNGRHPVEMLQPTLGEGGPAWTVELLDGNLHLMDTALRLYGHPGLLGVAAAGLSGCMTNEAGGPGVSAYYDCDNGT